MSQALLTAALPFLFAYEVSCRARTGSVRRKAREDAERFAPIPLLEGWFPRVTCIAGHKQPRQTIQLSTILMLVPSFRRGNFRSSTDERLKRYYRTCSQVKQIS
jgi:hypothetical protein